MKNPRHLPNTPDERPPRWSVLPPGIVVTLEAFPKRPSRSRDRCNPRSPGSNSLNCGELCRRIRQSLQRGTFLRAAVTRHHLKHQGRVWVIRSAARRADHSRRRRCQTPRSITASSTCRLTGFLLDDSRRRRTLASARDLARFRRHAQHFPFDADVRRLLALYLLLRISRDAARPPRDLQRLLSQFASREQRRMRDRLRRAVLRLIRRLPGRTRN